MTPSRASVASPSALMPSLPYTSALCSPSRDARRTAAQRKRAVAIGTRPQLMEECLAAAKTAANAAPLETGERELRRAGHVRHHHHFLQGDVDHLPFAGRLGAPKPKGHADRR